MFDETPESRRHLGRPEPDVFTRTLEQRVGDEAAERRLPRAERAGLGRELLVRALKQDGVKLPSDILEREPPPPGPLARLGAPAGSPRLNARDPRFQRPRPGAQTSPQSRAPSNGRSTGNAGNPPGPVRPGRES